MDAMDALNMLIVRQAVDGEADSAPSCETGNDYDGRMGLRIAAIFVIWITSSIGATFPVFAKNHQGVKVPSWAFFIAKYFGSGVIVATAFIHLLGPAEEALTNECLTGPITDYSWCEGIILMTVFVLFFVELMVLRYANFGNGHDHNNSISQASPRTGEIQPFENEIDVPYSDKAVTHVPGEDHHGHAREHNDIEEASNPFSLEEYKAQLTAIFILEFGIIFHSIFIGLTLAVSGDEFDTLFIVLIFHQAFEGLGLGSRLAVTPWPKNRKWTPYIMGLGYGFSTPIAIAVGLGVRRSYPPGSQTTLIVNGVFDSISAGILVYTGLVELMAHEFMFSSTMRNAKGRVMLCAFGLMCMGAGLMALLGKWA